MNRVRTTIKKGGRVIIPASFRKALHVKEGSDIILRFDDNMIHITTPLQELNKLQGMVREKMEKLDSPICLVDELSYMRGRGG